MSESQTGRFTTVASFAISVPSARACHVEGSGRHLQIIMRLQFNFNLLLVSCPGPLAVQIVARLPRKRHRDARAYIRPFGNGHCLAPATQKPLAERRRQRDTGGTRGRIFPSFWQWTLSRACVHPTLCQWTLSHACHAEATGRAAETKGHRRDARAYIVPRLTGGTPGRTSDPLYCACHAQAGNGHFPMPATQKRRGPRDTRGTPGRTSDHACLAKAAETKGHQRDARAYIRPEH